MSISKGLKFHYSTVVREQGCVRGSGGAPRQKLVRAVDLVAAHISETLTYYAFPDVHWTKIRTNNPLERVTAHRVGQAGLRAWQARAREMA